MFSVTYSSQEKNQGEYLDLLLLELICLMLQLWLDLQMQTFVCLLQGPQIEASSYFIEGFLMTSLKFKLQNYWSSRDFTFTMYKSY